MKNQGARYGAQLGYLMAGLKRRIRGWARSSPAAWRLYNLLNRARVSSSKMLPDSVYARMKHFEETGRILRLRKPSMFNEKVWWLKLNNRDPRLTVCSDKVEVRKFVAERGYGATLIPLVGVFERPEDIDFEEFPQRAFIKLSSASGINVAWDATQPFDRAWFVDRFGQALSQNYYWQSREWNYKNIVPKLLVEQHLEDEHLVDYRFLCFNGQVRLIFVDIETAAVDGTHAPHAKRNVYTRDFSLLPVRVGRENYDPTLVSRPPVLDEMIEMAECLAEEFPLVRVDLYWTGGFIRFGEMTFYPGGGNQVAAPLSFEREWGRWLDISSVQVQSSLGSRGSHG